MLKFCCVYWTSVLILDNLFIIIFDYDNVSLSLSCSQQLCLISCEYGNIVLSQNWFVCTQEITDSLTNN